MKSRVISIVQLAAGMGRSIVATSLAGELSRFARVALIDCNPFHRRTTRWGALRQEELASARLVTHSASTPSALLDRVYRLRQAAEYVVLDGAPEPGITSAMVAIASFCLIPVDVTRERDGDPAPTLEAYRSARRVRRPRLRIVRNCAGPSTSGGDGEQERWNGTGPKILRTCLTRRSSYAEALEIGRTAAEMRDPIARDEVQALAMELMVLLRPAKVTQTDSESAWPSTVAGELNSRALLHVTG